VGNVIGAVPVAPLIVVGFAFERELEPMRPILTSIEMTPILLDGTGIEITAPGEMPLAGLNSVWRDLGQPAAQRADVAPLLAA
jgi:hypothetical protein